MENTRVTTFNNSEGETIAIDHIVKGEFAGHYVLIIVGDEPGEIAPHLLDKGTIEWLLRELPKL